MLHGMEFEESSTVMALLKMVLRSHFKPVLKEENVFGQSQGVIGEKWIALDGDALGVPPSDSEIEGLFLNTMFLRTVVAVSSFFNILQLSPEG